MAFSKENPMTSSNIYDQRYLGDYREQLSGYEIARWEALEHFIMHVVKLGSARKVLDYGAGSGLHVGLWEKTFRTAELSFCDISPVAMEKFIVKYPRYADRFYLLGETHSRLSETTYDVIVSVEVMEHVEDLGLYLRDVHRLLMPGGCFVWTTPCANRFSIEHIFSAITRKIEQTEEGYRRWSWEDPTHLRRLRSNEIGGLLRQNGFTDIRFRFRSHFFSFICRYFPLRGGRCLRNRLMTLDYVLFRSIPNGASMIGAANKPFQK